MMNKEYFYGNIKSVKELTAFSDMAKLYDKVAVGITKKKNIYVLDDLGKPKKITIDEMANILGIDIETAQLIVDSEGRYQIPSPTVEENPLDVDFDEAEKEADENIVSINEETNTDDSTETSEVTSTFSLLETISKQLDKIVNLLTAFFLE